MSDDAQTLLSRATPRRANGEPIENEMTRVNSDVLLAAFDEIERLRARMAVLEQALGLLTTLALKMEIDVSDPLGMARNIEATVRAALGAKP